MSTPRRRSASTPARGCWSDDVERDETLEDPRCVFQILRRHFTRYTPEMVQRICGISREEFMAVARCADRELRARAHERVLLRERVDAALRGVQMIRTAAILQLLLGNVGRPGGGIMAMRGPRVDPGVDRHPDPV